MAPLYKSIRFHGFYWKDSRAHRLVLATAAILRCREIDWPVIRRGELKGNNEIICLFASVCVCFGKSDVLIRNLHLFPLFTLSQSLRFYLTASSLRLKQSLHRLPLIYIVYCLSLLPHFHPYTSFKGLTLFESGELCIKLVHILILRCTTKIMLMIQRMNYYTINSFYCNDLNHYFFPWTYKSFNGNFQYIKISVILSEFLESVY